MITDCPERHYRVTNPKIPSNPFTTFRQHPGGGPSLRVREGIDLPSITLLMETIKTSTPS